MRPDLPWNVAGIPPEAREAARAAARREGLSVGEWLTRRILRSFADAGDEEELNRDSWTANPMYRAQAPSPDPSRPSRDTSLETPSSFETGEMLDRVSRSSAETGDLYRRIEEQLRGVARRLESSERSQTENNRALNKAATEMNIAAREQTQAFDQLGAHVVGLADRIERVERANQANGMKDAVKGLHTGLSRLADQITQNATQSATQISALAGNLESVAGRLGQQRDDADSAAHAFEQRFAALDDRIYAVERNAQASAAALERALDTLQQAHGDHDAERERHDVRRAESDAATQGAIARLEENIARIEARGPDPEMDRRLTGIEKSLGNLVARLETNEPVSAKAIEDSLRKLANRVEATENRQRDTASEFRSVLNDATTRLATLETKPAVAASQAAPVFAAPPPPPAPAAAFDAPPFPDVPTPGAPPPFQPSADPFPPAASFESAEPFGAAPFDAAPDTAFQAAQAGESFLSAARRSARAAASQAEAEQAGRGFAWATPRAAAVAEPAEGKGRSRFALIGLVALIAIALIAGIVLSQGLLGGSSGHGSGIGAMFPAKQPPAPAPQAGTPLHALAPTADDTGAPAATTTAQTRPQVLPPLPQKTVTAPQTHAVPAPTPPAQQSTAPQAQPQQQAAVPALDKLTQLANGGNAKAETIVGLKYLSAPVNEAEAAKWLERAAESGEPVAQYRLGALYQYGKGVGVDPAKATHWFQAAAMQGNVKAMHNLAVALAEGTGIKKNPAEAARWFSKAASMGLGDSQFNLAVLYERGEGVPQSLLDAFKWYAIAAAGGDGESKARVGALATQLSQDDRLAAQHAADTFKPAPSDPRANTAPQMGELIPG
jgi:localization factor PodJL